MVQVGFTDHVISALARLYDEPYLQTHPLARYIAPERPGELRGRAVQRALLDAIQALRPEGGHDGADHAWRIYRYLFLRYAQALPPLDVARQLAISERQARRTNQQAVAALASIIQDRYPLEFPTIPPGHPYSPDLDADPSAKSTPSSSESLRSISPASGESIVDREARHLARGDKRSTDLAEVVDGLRPILEGLADHQSMPWAIELPVGLPSLAVDRVIVRQVILGLWMFGLEWGAAPLALVAEETRGEIALRLQTSGARTDAANGDPQSDSRLAIVLQLVEHLHGRLEVALRRTEIRVTAYLPAARPPLILIGDDNPAVIDVFRRYLETVGYTVLVAPTGNEVIRLAREHHPAAITLDVMMPEQDGWETLQELKNHPITQDIPVIVCSVLREADLAHFLGAAALVPKPVTQPMLLDALSRCGLSPPA